MQNRTTPTPVPPSDRIGVAELRDVGLFGGLDDVVLQHLASTLKVLKRGSDEVIFRDGDEAREYLTNVGWPLFTLTSKGRKSKSN